MSRKINPKPVFSLALGAYSRERSISISFSKHFYEYISCARLSTSNILSILLYVQSYRFRSLNDFFRVGDVGFPDILFIFYFLSIFQQQITLSKLPMLERVNVSIIFDVFSLRFNALVTLAVKRQRLVEESPLDTPLFRDLIVEFSPFYRPRMLTDSLSIFDLTLLRRLE